MNSALSRYISRALLARVAVLLVGLAALMMILEFLADGDQVLAASDSIVLPILRYTVLRLPEILAELIPVAAMLGALLTFAELARHSELTAMFAAGVSRIRLALAALPVALLIAGTQLLIQDQAVPVAASKLRAWGVGDYEPGSDTSSWLRDGDDIVRLRSFDAAAGKLNGVTIFRRDREGNLVEQIDAAAAIHGQDSWLLEDVSRSEVGAGTVEHLDQLAWPSRLDPTLILATIAHPRETSAAKLLQVLWSPGLGTQPTYRYQVWLQERLAAPATTILLVMLGVALARPLRGGAAQGLLLAAGIAVGFLIWTFDGLVLTFGDLGLVPPVLAAWTPLPVIAALALWIGLHGPQRRSGPWRRRPHDGQPPPRMSASTPVSVRTAVDAGRRK